MRCRNGSVVTVFGLAALVSLSLYTAWHRDRGYGIDSYEKQFTELQQRLFHAEQENRKRSQDLSNVLDEIKRAVAEKRNAFENHTVEEIKWKVMNLTSKLPMQFSNIYMFLPHLLGHDDSLQPNVLYGHGRTGVSIVIGIPTVKRDKQSYLLDTLSSLFSEMSTEEKQDCVVIVFIAEVNLQYVDDLANGIKESFPREIQSGVLEIISPPASYYPDLNNVKETFGDSKERVRWRTKQNLDYSFLMLYAQPKGVYYLQLEDDIVAKPQFFQYLKNFADQQPSDDWMILEFSQLGFIGKLFKSKDLPLVAEFFLMFYRDKPIDWLLDHFLWVKVCNPEKDAKHCDRQKSSLRIRYRPSLFQHIGTHSSLIGKIQNLKDKDFDKKVLYKPHPNPPAKLSTSLKVYQHYTLEKAYTGQECFWSFSPVAGDYILFEFEEPLVLVGYFFKSGNIEHPGDKLFNTTVAVLPVQNIENLPGGLQKDEDGFVQIGKFLNGIAEGEINRSLGKIKAIRLKVLSESPVWALLSEIFIKVGK
ncbi:alpha-1,3-mannosyl-glycoprotein 4-beta-N-acetylglucosaminyltransferase-like protein MGAT4D [Spea bombifrons]|uniref:alpha-1,3-mannosyl-glycoprotein 4-beta-N-acetylglucosaminyltransferase-like protein MGAT4D n=1 Tax=Spea bombifrons TaxID=233779 RepID=UPI00234BB215|nr:alpha-1,3-mannosyl-glycoprotein 4-beta-N-acetylglucosaminyltransferase-like protein MGAT4D [Spea bombifrons]